MANQRALVLGLVCSSLFTVACDDEGTAPPLALGDAAAPDAATTGTGGQDGSAAVPDLAYDRPAAPPSLMGHGWTVSNLGDVGANPGRLTVGQGVLLSGGGTDLAGTADSGVFVFRKLAGDGEIVVRVRSLQRADVASTAGVMVRADSADPTAASVFYGLLADPTKGGQSIVRVAKGQPGVASPPDPQVRNQFLRLRREGRHFTWSRSSDRLAWVKAGSADVDMPDEVAFGIALSAHSATTPTIAEIDFVRLLAVDATAPREAWDLEPLGVAGLLPAAELRGDRVTVSAIGDLFTTTWENGAALLAPRTSDTGSLTLTARIDSLGGPQAPAARLALTFREGGPARLSPTSRNILISMSNAGVLEFQKRDRSTNFDPGKFRGAVALPVWLRLQRTDDPVTGKTLVTGLYSGDGEAWTTLDTAEFSIPDPTMMGLIFTSGTLTSYATAQLSHFSVSTTPPPVPDGGAPDADMPDAGMPDAEGGN